MSKTQRALSAIWRHKKTGGYYTHLYNGVLEADLSEVVVYRAHKDGTVWVRPASEFYDGRFENVADDG
jgi:hypothetical protein